MSYNKPIRRIAIVGTGVIGASWAAQYLARGFDVVATDPASNAEASLRKYVDEAWPDLTSIGLSQGASRDRLSFTTKHEGSALPGRSRPGKRQLERPDFKKKLFADMDEVTLRLIPCSLRAHRGSRRALSKPTASIRSVL